MNVHNLALWGALFAFSTKLCAENFDPYFGKRHLIITPEFVYVKRSNNISTNKSMVIRQTQPLSCGCSDLQTSCPNTKILPTNVYQAQGHASGLRLTFDYLLDKKVTWQGRYTGLLHWSGEKTAICTGSLAFPFLNGVNQTYDYSYADEMKATSNTYYWSSEINYIYHVTPQRVDYFSVSWLFGLRYINFKENFKLKAMTASCGNVVSSSNYSIQAKNRLAGVQLGGTIEGNLGYNFTYGVPAKMGAMVDFDKYNATFRDFNNAILIRNNNPSDFNLAFLGEIAPFVLFNLSKSVLFKVSYELVYLNNLSLAMNQITFVENQPFNVKNQIRKEGAFMFYGFYIGLGFDF
jgi:hypothetical protein